MMMMLMMLIFMIPLCWLVPLFWLHQYIYIIMFVMFSLKFSFNYMFVGVSYFMGIDLLSFMMILLSFWICLLMIMASEKIYSMNYFNCFFLLMIMMLLLFLYMTFSSLNLFIFYIFFEASLIPIFFLILGWGYQPERLQAGIYLLFYTLLASLPMMVSIFYCYYEVNSLDFYYLVENLDSFMIYICMNMVFFIKMPMYFVHLWLPKAHVEAPVSGSMILAGVMLKLGGYGLLRLMTLFLGVGMKINYIFVVISLVGGILVSLICLRQVDIKALIAYSSISHMGLVLGGIMTMSYWGLCGSLVMMIAHGLCSSGLFCLANVSYERIKSRSLFLNKGLINIMPNMTLWWFLFSCCNMASPPSLNLLGEIMLINSLVSWSFMNMLMLMFISFFSAVYTLYLYSSMQHGNLSSMFYSFSSGDIREFLLLMLHWLPLNILILKSEYLVLWI